MGLSQERRFRTITVFSSQADLVIAQPAAFAHPGCQVFAPGGVL